MEDPRTLPKSNFIEHRTMLREMGFTRCLTLVGNSQDPRKKGWKSVDPASISLNFFSTENWPGDVHAGAQTCQIDWVLRPGERVKLDLSLVPISGSRIRLSLGWWRLPRSIWRLFLSTRNRPVRSLGLWNRKPCGVMQKWRGISTDVHPPHRLVLLQSSDESTSRRTKWYWQQLK